MVSQCSRYCLCLAVTFLKFFHIDSVDFLFTTPKNCDTRDVFLTSSLTFEKVTERPGIAWHHSGYPTCPYFEEEKKLAENEVPKIGIWGP